VLFWQAIPPHWQFGLPKGCEERSGRNDLASMNWNDNGTIRSWSTVIVVTPTRARWDEATALKRSADCFSANSWRFGPGLNRDLNEFCRNLIDAKLDAFLVGARMAIISDGVSAKTVMPACEECAHRGDLARGRSLKTRRAGRRDILNRFWNTTEIRVAARD